jgi:acyl-CoA synthetase (AMP-forming)/AMP-acid ligase II
MKLPGLMMQMPLLISSLIRHADQNHGDTEIVSRRVEGDIHRCTYRDVHRRARQMANALDGLGVRAGDRVATVAWNGHRHLELFYAVSGTGAVLHTLNPRLHPDQITWIVNHAEDKLLFFDLNFLPLIEAVAPRLRSVKGFVAMCDRERAPKATKLPELVCFEDLINSHSDAYEWAQLDENLASSLCYTSGTTGDPKGVLYSHRSTILHALALSLPDSASLSARDVVLPVAPMFHANAWGLPYAAPMVGAKLVFPGPALDGKSVYELIEQEKATFVAGVPSIWQMILAYTEGNNLRFSSLRRTLIGGSACPPTMIRLLRDKYGVEVLHAWGMTETSPLATCCTLKHKHETLSGDDRNALQCKQGRAVYGVELKITGEDGGTLKWDGTTFGELLVRGPWIVRGYHRNAGADAIRDGWLATGDVATIDPDGYVQITDRRKDLIKSGGEWISSIQIENIAMSHPAVAMAACIAAKHPKWDERPLLVVVRKSGAEVARDELLAHYAGKIAKWQVPDDVVFVEAIPIGPTGKMLKTRLREQLKDHRLPTV